MKVYRIFANVASVFARMGVAAGYSWDQVLQVLQVLQVQGK